ncbi:MULTISPECIES: hypothetical protein [Streptomyces]|uniref:Terpene synthase n=1 Tax=Streptomyces lycii TaxID=2654337 RepID=A0ABQ7FS66_9ACTN|nr:MULTISPECIES: hypothetical protein [Streptomyces]KAF4410809.1 hypothetical protein GCU69_01995 [Streptomyces lycii]PGH48994.1 hypothetical protein CRI70_20160 [Streptomyces sp. Ru87]
MAEPIAPAATLPGHRPPPFYCPVPSAVHPQVRRIEERALDWLEARGVYADDVERAWNAATHAAEFSCRLAPYGDEDRLVLFAQWSYWLFALDDDRLDVEPAAGRCPEIVDLGLRLVRCLEAPGCGLLGTGPTAAALDDLVARTVPVAGEVRYRRLVDGVRDLVLGVAWQSGNAGRRVLPTPAEYIPGRISDVGTRFDAAFTEIANDIEVPGVSLYSAPVRALTELTGFIAACDNDLLSYAKENGPGAQGQNMVTVLAHHHRCPPEEAVTRAVALRDRAMTLFLRLREQVLRTAGPDLRGYLGGLGHWIAGNIRWSDTAPRYASPRRLHRLPVPGATLGVTWRDTPTDSRGGAPGIPTVDWWWDQLDC